MLDVRYGSYYGVNYPGTIMTFPEKDENPEPVLYGPKGEPLYLAKPKFGYRMED